MNSLTKTEVARLRDLLVELEDGRAKLMNVTFVQPTHASPVMEYRIFFVRPNPANSRPKVATDGAPD